MTSVDGVPAADPCDDDLDGRLALARHALQEQALPDDPDQALQLAWEVFELGELCLELDADDPRVPGWMSETLEALEALGEAIEATDDDTGDADGVRALCSGLAGRLRFRRWLVLGDGHDEVWPAELDRAVTELRQAVDTTPADEVDLTDLWALFGALNARYDKGHSAADRGEAIARSGQLLAALGPVPQPDVDPADDDGERLDEVRVDVHLLRAALLLDEQVEADEDAPEEPDVRQRQADIRLQQVVDDMEEIRRRRPVGDPDGQQALLMLSHALLMRAGGASTNPVDAAAALECAHALATSPDGDDPAVVELVGGLVGAGSRALLGTRQWSPRAQRTLDLAIDLCDRAELEPTDRALLVALTGVLYGLRARAGLFRVLPSHEIRKDLHAAIEHVEHALAVDEADLPMDGKAWRDWIVPLLIGYLIQRISIRDDWSGAELELPASAAVRTLLSNPEVRADLRRAQELRGRLDDPAVLEEAGVLLDMLTALDQGTLTTGAMAGMSAPAGRHRTTSAAGGLGLGRALGLAAQARETRDPAVVADAVRELRRVLRELTPGNPVARGIREPLCGLLHDAAAGEADPRRRAALRAEGCEAALALLADPDEASTARAVDHLVAHVLAAVSSDPPETDLLPAGRVSAALRAEMPGLTAPAAALRVRAALAAIATLPAEPGESDTNVDERSGNERSVDDLVADLECRVSRLDTAQPPARQASALGDLAAAYYRAGRNDLAVEAGLQALRRYRAHILVSGRDHEGLALAADAEPLWIQLVDWCLTAERPAVAVEVAETGRALVLQASAQGRTAQETLRKIGRPDLAEALARPPDSAAEARREALRVLAHAPLGLFLLSDTVTAPEIGDGLWTAGADAVIYLLPPTHGTTGLDPARTARALLVRSGGLVEDVPLPGLSLDEDGPLRAERAAFAELGTQAGPGVGRDRWCAALDRLLGWAHEAAIGPLLDHIAGWQLHRMPRLVLVPAGELGAIPWHAARCTDQDGRVRYACERLVISYASSARQLLEACRRPALPLGESPALVADPTDDLLYAASAARVVRDRYYPDALLLGSGDAPASGAGTVAEVLALLPAPGRDGASLLHVSAHACAGAVPTESLIRLAGGDLDLAAILEQARDRPADAAGGLIIVDACETDLALAAHDEALTLATSLLAAGATGVIGTRWPVNDMVTAVFTVILHDNLRRHPPAEALRRTQVWMLDPDRTPPDGMPDRLLRVMQLRNVASPTHWAGFTYHGAPQRATAR